MDARNIASISTSPIVDVTITSPPYFDMKDYGYPEQIGFGQKYDDYLNDLKKVFKGVYELTKDTGSLWVIIDTFRKAGAVVPLPFDFVHKISDIGWKLQEVIIWEKDKTVPWVHQGQMRNMFEYILVFAKNEKYKFHLDRIRQWDNLKKWWVKYPERYNPNGKAPEAIWHFPIPVQGSWGQNYIRHFCPLPEDMIAQIIKLTTDEGDVVLDPFAGSGAVLSQAAYMYRKYIGTELNQDYIAMFERYLAKTKTSKRKKYRQGQKITWSQNSFSDLIINLRALKFARVLYKKITNSQKNNIKHIFVSLPVLNDDGKALVSYHFISNDTSCTVALQNEINTLISKIPLSKFGILSTFIWKSEVKDINTTPLFGYTKTSTHKFVEEIPCKGSPHSFIISPIKVDLNEEDYE